MKIKVKIKKGKKHSVILLLIAFIVLVLTDIIGNLYLSAAAVILGLAVFAATITDMIGDWRKKKEKGAH
ncbi:hypothetical protein [Bacillus cereus]|uniref:hypothetical protein n=1 Tax=Bacillus cereus TaxID=1396 RepID=UPI0025A146CB|nr:hypothetical protein [Bacillus cereus]MDM5464403.1 hypothetical protein [Bacillus cereus]